MLENLLRWCVYVMLAAVLVVNVAILCLHEHRARNYPEVLPTYMFQPGSSAILVTPDGRRVNIIGSKDDVVTVDRINGDRASVSWQCGEESFCGAEIPRSMLRPVPKPEH